jgi:FMN-dependent NADH-azoreductase
MASAQLTAVPGSDPLPHLDTATGLARVMPAELRTPAQAASWALTEELINEIKEADTILLGLSLYNFGAPRSVKAWVDHLIAPGLSVDAETHAPLLGGREFVVLASRGGGLRRRRTPPRVGPRGTMAPARHLVHRPGTALHHRRAHPRQHEPAMAELIPLAQQSLAEAERAMDALWTPVPALA